MGNIVVAGDVAIDWLCWNTKKREPSEKDRGKHPNWSLYPGMRMTALPGGALLLAELMRGISNSDETKLDVISPKIDDLPNISPNDVIHSITKLGIYPVDQNKDDDSEVYRVRNYCGFCGPQESHDDKLQPLQIIGDTPVDVSMVIIDDAGNKYRYTREYWPQAILQESSNPLVILKMSRPFPTEKYNNSLWDHLYKNNADRLCVIVNANDLRKEGADISRRLSWEKTAEDCIREIQVNPGLKTIKGCQHLIIRFGLDGAIYYSNKNGDISAFLIYDPKFIEDGFVGAHEGDMQGTMAAFTAVFSSYLYKNEQEPIVPGQVRKAIQYGILGSQTFFKKGFGSAKKDQDKSFAPTYPKDIFPIPKEEKDKSLPIASIAILPSNISERSLLDKKSDKGTILNCLSSEKLESIAYNVVKNGIDNIPPEIPICQYSKLMTADRSEIESYQGMKNLMQEYIFSDSKTRPLSIAVFGPPGSGKSFGVTNLAESVAPGMIQKIEFNLSQFESPKDLACAFHQVRDYVLKGKIPLVFFDEFDSNFEGDLGWLKYFLSPMQDGEFKEGEILHPIGKSIFVFAGGTKSSFLDFSCENGTDEEKQKFRDVKGTDFISRLRGYVNVLGPNQLEGHYELMYVIRRALLLRSMLDRNAKHLINSKGECSIDESVLRAFLRAPKYKHGARSMEAIVDMSTLEGKEIFEKASLPSKDQLDLHVDAEIFTNLVRQGTYSLEKWENIARGLHEEYLRTVREGKNESGPACVEWDELSDEYKLSNFRQAEQIPFKLEKIGCGIVPAKNEPPQIIQFEADEIDTLARNEHDLWMREKTERGWRSGSERDDEKKIHPCLVPWENLSDDDRQKDIMFSKEIPRILANAGFEVEKLL